MAGLSNHSCHLAWGARTVHAVKIALHASDLAAENHRSTFELDRAMVHTKFAPKSLSILTEGFEERKAADAAASFRIEAFRWHPSSV